MDRRREMLRHFPALLARWAGGDAQMYELTVTHATLLLRVTRRDSPGHLEVACLGPTSIKGPVEWSDSNLKVNLDDPDGFVVTDESCGLEIKTEGVEVAEYLKTR